MYTHNSCFPIVLWIKLQTTRALTKYSGLIEAYITRPSERQSACIRLLSYWSRPARFSIIYPSRSSTVDFVIFVERIVAPRLRIRLYSFNAFSYFQKKKTKRISAEWTRPYDGSTRQEKIRVPNYGLRFQKQFLWVRRWPRVRTPLGITVKTKRMSVFRRCLSPDKLRAIRVNEKMFRTDAVR